MSIRCQNWVWDHSQTTGNDRLVLLAIADEADDDGTNAYPSVDRLARKVRVNRATVMRAILRLEEIGELGVVRPERHGRGKHNTYSLPAYAAAQERSQSATITPEAENGAKWSHKGAERRAQVRPDPKTHRPVEPENPLPASAGVDAAFEEFWLAYPKARRLAKPDAKRAFRDALRRAPAVQIIAAARRYEADPNRLDEFTPYPQKWLKQERWNAPPEPARRLAATRANRSAANAAAIAHGAGLELLRQPEVGS